MSLIIALDRRSTRQRAKGSRIAALLCGAIGALGLPLAIPGVHHAPMFDAVPRELFLLIGVAHLYGGRRGWWNGFGYFAVTLFWLYVPMTRHGPMSMTQAVIAGTVLVAYGALYWGIVPLLARLASSLLHPWIAFAAAVLTVDWVRSWAIGGFPWAEWSWAVVRDKPLLQLASVVGAHGITALIAITGAAVNDGYKRHKSAIAVAAILIATHIWGYVRLSNLSPDGEQLAIGVTQGNIAQDIKNVDIDNAPAIAATYERLTQTVVEHGAELVLWPEAAWPRRPSAESDEFAFHTSVPLIAGVATLDFDDIDNFHVKNSAFDVDTKGVIAGRYDKQALVPFGEYVPFAKYLHMAKIVPELGAIEPGNNPSPLHGLGVLICYDGLFGRIARAEVRAGARALVNMTNDAWYDDSSAPYHHRDVYVLRAVETDRWLVRATNTGFSTVVDPRGRTVVTTKLGEEAWFVHTIGLRDTTTLYVRFGDIVVWASLAGLIAGALASIVIQTRKSDDLI